ncbi:hypothetical protein J1N35_020118 [Gossypium stocksii]|uniref:Uncharacterized protein n=1 Tax=Gossypium stocksii TaxID=47602 RepID=A0A9D3VDE7_9ROSI|nr:hypothetical protein J1N35_020118 [Gossypium stocksii]
MIIISSPKFLLIFFTIILSNINLSSCRRYTLKTLKPQEPTPMAAAEQHFSRPSVAEKGQPIYEVSYRTVPGGPDPLHN